MKDKDKNKEVIPCFCGSYPLAETKIADMGDEWTKDIWQLEVIKYRCPVCPEKELPFLDYRFAARSWNDIAAIKDYRKRTLEYNVHGVCVAPPCEEIQEQIKLPRSYIQLKFYFDNGFYYFCHNTWIKDGGGGRGLWLNERGFGSIVEAKQAAVEFLKRIHKDEIDILMKFKFINEVFDLLKPKQLDLFEANP